MDSSWLPLLDEQAGTGAMCSVMLSKSAFQQAFHSCLKVGFEFWTVLLFSGVSLWHFLGLVAWDFSRHSSVLPFFILFMVVAHEIYLKLQTVLIVAASIIKRVQH